MLRLFSLPCLALLLAFFQACHAGSLLRRDPVNGLVGFATLNGGTSGGLGGATIVVTTLSELKAAVGSSSPKIVKFATTISGDGEYISVGSHTTLIGDCGATLYNVGLRIKDQRNVVIRNIKIKDVYAPTHLILVQNSVNIWIDHNELSTQIASDKDLYAGAINIINASDYITISWNKILNHRLVSLVGHSDSNAAEDKGHFKITYHHNYFLNVVERVPSLRFALVHIYNNLFETITGTAIALRLETQAIIQYNKAVAVPTPFIADSTTHWVLTGNDWGTPTIPIPSTNPGTFVIPGYPYTPDAVTRVQAVVKASAGVCII